VSRDVQITDDTRLRERVSNRMMSLHVYFTSNIIKKRKTLKKLKKTFVNSTTSFDNTSRTSVSEHIAGMVDNADAKISTASSLEE